MTAVFIGLVFLAISGVVFYFDRRLVRNGQRADAQVVNLQEVQRKGRPTYRPVVRFRTADGTEVVERTRVDSNPAIAQPGDRVRVVYQIGTRNDVAIDTLRGRGLRMGTLMVIVGLGVIAIGIYQMLPGQAHSSAAGSFALGILVGLIFFATGIFVFYRDRRLVRNGRRADAEVVGLRAETFPGPAGGPAYYPVVRFRTVGGADVVAGTKGTRSNRPSARRGDRVRVLYQVGNPENVVIDTAWGRGLVLGVIAVIAGLGMLAYTISQMVR